MLKGISKPTLLTENHEIKDFNCGEGVLNDWLKKRALKNQTNNASHTIVICQNNSVVGYYAIAAGSIERTQAPKPIARNMPEHIPIIVLGRLAIDKKYQRQRLGAALLKDALLRSLTISRDIGVRAILVHTLSKQAKEFYLQYGFVETPFEPMTLMLSISTLRKLYSSN